MFLWQKHEKHMQLSTLTEKRAYAFMSDYCPNLYPYITFPLSGQVIKRNILKKVLLETFLNVPNGLKIHFLQNKGVFVKLNSL